MNELQFEVVETLRQLTLQIMLIAAGVFAIAGGFVSSAKKKFRCPLSLAIALFLFASSVFVGYLLHGIIIELLYANKFNPHNSTLIKLGFLQIGTFSVGGLFFMWFVIKNIWNNNK